VTEQAVDTETDVKEKNPHLDEVGDQYLTFNLAGEDYGIDILRVQEIRGWDDATRLPNAPDYVKGVVNIRGTIVPVYDLRQKFNLEFKDYDQNTVVIVIKVASKGNYKSVGIVVDGVSDVLHGAHIEITQSPDFGAEMITDAISGLATFDRKMVVLIDVDRLLVDAEEASNEDSAAEEGAEE